ncbi:MAG: hypothetical protein EPO21_11780 [Chloroflexota bacterium]|nr:MAG: hypothetical protein EPO21_11780 [Chloroflexota bacterium]
MALQIFDEFGNAISSVALRGKGVKEGDTPVDVNGWNLADSQGNRMGLHVLATQWGFNGSTHDRWRNNHEVTALANAARNTDVYSGDLVNYNARGIIILLDVTAVGAPAGQIDQLKVQFKAPSGVYQAFHAWGTLGINAPGVKAFQIYPGAASTSSWTGTLQALVPRTFRIGVLNANQLDSITYSVTVAFIV